MLKVQYTVGCCLACWVLTATDFFKDKILLHSTHGSNSMNKTNFKLPDHKDDQTAINRHLGINSSDCMLDTLEWQALRRNES